MEKKQFLFEFLSKNGKQTLQKLCTKATRKES
nr:MAG TPA: hypothetical protein [Caudoviricetes sp.]